MTNRNLKPLLDRLKQSIAEAERCDTAIAGMMSQRMTHLTAVDHYMDALRLIGEDPNELLGDAVYTPPDESARVRVGKGKRYTDETAASKKRGGRGMSEKWREIITEVVEAYPREFDINGLRILASQLGHDVTRSTAGRQLQDYAAGQYLERLANGRYRATELGAKSLGIKLGKKAQKNETLPAQTGNVSESDGESSASPSSGDEKVTRLFDR